MDRRWMESRASEVMAISETDLQNRSKTDDYNNANRQLAKRMETVALSTTNVSDNRVREGDFGLMKRAYRALRCIVLFACRHPVGALRILGCVWRRSCKIDFDKWNTHSPREGLYFYRCYWHEGRVKCTYGYPAPLSYEWLPLYVIGTRELSQNGWLLGD